MKIIAIILFVLAAAMIGCGLYTASLGATFTTLIITVCAVTTATQGVVVAVIARSKR